MQLVRVSSLAPGLLFLAACASPPPKKTATVVPSVESAVDYFVGSAVEGPRIASAELKAAGTVLCARIRLRWFESMPAVDLVPIATQTRLVLASRGDEPILPTTGLLGGARVARGEAAAKFVARADAAPIPEFEEEKRGAPDPEKKDRFPRSRRTVDRLAVLPESVTASFVAFADREFEIAGEGKIQKRVRIQLVPSEDAKSANVTLIVEDEVALRRSEGEDEVGSPGTEAAEPEGPSARIERELVVLDEPVGVDAGGLLILMRSPRSSEPGRAWSIAIDLSESPASAVSNELAACQASVVAASQRLRERLQKPDDLSLKRQRITAASEALALDESRRAALRTLARLGEAPLSIDLALTAEDAQLAAFAGTLKSAELGKASLDALGWEIDRRAWKFLIKSAQEGELDSVLESILLLHAGEVGRYPSTLQSFVKRSKSPAEITEKIVQESRSLLEDGNPASRVRAFDWLRARKLEPEGFDPLAALDVRRAVLAKLAAEAEKREEERRKGTEK